MKVRLILIKEQPDVHEWYRIEKQVEGTDNWDSIKYYHPTRKELAFLHFESLVRGKTIEKLEILREGETHV